MKRAWMGTAAILALAMAVRLPLLTGSFWMDEAAQALESARPWSQQLQIAYDFQPPLFHLIVAAMIRVSSAEWWLRLSSLLPAVAAIGLSMAAVRRWSSERAAWITGILLAISSLHVFYSQELRPYALSAFWVALALWQWTGLVKDRLTLSSSLIFVTALYGAFMSSYVSLFFLPALVLATGIWRFDRLKTIISLMLISLLFFGAWFPGLQSQLRVGSDLRQTLPSWSELVSFSQVKALPLTLAKYLVGVWRVDIGLRDAVLIGGPLAAALWLQLRAAMESRKALLRGKVPSWLLWPLLLAVTILTTWIFSFITPVLAPKRLLFALPWFFATVAAVPVLPRWRWMFQGTIMAFFAWQSFGLLAYWSMPSLQREPWRPVMTAISTRFEPQSSAVVFAFDEPFAPWRWYDHAHLAEYTTGKRVLHSAEEVRDSLNGIEKKKTALVFDYLRDVTDPYRVIDAVLTEKGFTPAGTIDGGTLGFIHVWERPHFYAENIRF